VTDARTLALELPGTTEAPHHDRRAFRVKRIYATLAADERTMNLMLTPEEQAMFCRSSDAFSPVSGAWGAGGATTVDLASVSDDDLATALEVAHSHAVG
jgi:hypothetical protein